MSSASTVNLLNSTASSSGASATEHKTSLDQDAFLKIMIAQLNHQDPNNPMDDKEMTAQLAQFSSLEMLTNINTNIKSLVQSQSQNTILSGVSYIGKSIKASGYNLAKSGDTVSTVYYSLGESVSNLQVNIYASDGSLVRSQSLGASGTGDFTYVWDGKDTDGNKMADGTYGVAIIAEDSSGEPVVVQSKISGVVTGVKTVNGTTMLTLADGRNVQLSLITEVVNTATTNDATNSGSSS